MVSRIPDTIEQHGEEHGKHGENCGKHPFITTEVTTNFSTEDEEDTDRYAVILSFPSGEASIAFGTCKVGLQRILADMESAAKLIRKVLAREE